ncbi:unnamed protein product [Owenia fusiformis]|uniref:Amine oxidase n=1 Tax=Owenia fusiformis TaxID=6347 RepID=A0A8S4Q6Q4_OWEFU|nr:unnamed protein product [Owenia fusiformis]
MTAEASRTLILCISLLYLVVDGDPVHDDTMTQKESLNNPFNPASRLKREIKDDSTCTKCPQSEKQCSPSPSCGEKGIFDMLDPDEMRTVYSALVSKGIVDPWGTSFKNTYIHRMALLPPEKAKALDYLDNGGSHPGRFAEVHVIRGNSVNPDLMEYKVGPVCGDSMNVTQLYKDGELSFNSQVLSSSEYFTHLGMMRSFTDTIDLIIQESFGNHEFRFRTLSPQGFTASERNTRYVLVLRIQATSSGYDINHMPLSFTIYSPGTDVSIWKIHRIFYLNQGPFDTAEDLLEAYTKGELRKFSLPRNYKSTAWNATFPQRDGTGWARKGANIAPPRTYQPSGSRINCVGNRITWMGWEFSVGFSQVRGPSVHDVRFKGERILWENSLNEVSLVYSSDASGDANNILMDSLFGLGDQIKPFVPGVDCPEYAHTINLYRWIKSVNFASTVGAGCVFEADMQGPLWRRGDSYSAGLRNHVLVVRIPLTAGNYDYTIDFRFYMDGKMQTIAEASGYLQAAFWDDDNPNRRKNNDGFDGFGYKVKDFTQGAIHDHAFGFKVDMDIGGTKNSFQKIAWKADTVGKAFRSQGRRNTNPPYFENEHTRFLKYVTLKNEIGLRKNLDNPHFWVVVNDAKKNKWGVPRGYRIQMMATGANILPSDHIANKALAFTKYHCAVTRQRDTERYLSNPYDVNQLAEPVGSLDNYLDNEPITNQDIVTWITPSLNHLPTSEDIPMTASVSTGFWLKPHNYFDNLAVMDVPKYLKSSISGLNENPPDFEPCQDDTKPARVNVEL